MSDLSIDFSELACIGVSFSRSAFPLVSSVEML